ncbi:MAG: hypothetical protein RJA57_634 [Bacteroidota bacterium]|jgi:SAM-dependent methyltransferase
MFEFHADRKRYFDIQELNAKGYVLPFIEEKVPIRSGMRVLEIGCGEGGVLKAFIDRGCTGVGVELDPPRVELARQFMADPLSIGTLRLISRDIYTVDPASDLGGRFDIILLKDVIEHIHDQERLIRWMKQFLVPDGIIFFGFPPWYMPFGGHQQMCRSGLSRIPWIHLLPRTVYRSLLRWKKEPVEALLEIRDTGISIERFERICKNSGYHLLHRRHYLLNPIYRWKFGWKPRRQAGWVRRIPFFRNFVTTCVYYCIQPDKSKS